MSGRVIYTCPFVPAEWIKAHGLIPSRFIPKSVDGPVGSAPGLCPFALAFINAAVAQKDVASVITTTSCDQMRRAADLISLHSDKIVFAMNVPHTWQTTAAQRMYISELQRLAQFLVRLGGKTPSSEHLIQIMIEYDAKRAEIRDAAGLLRPSDYAKLIAEFNMTGQVSVEQASYTPSGVPVTLIGSPMMQQDIILFDVIEQSGGYVALNGTENGERTLPAPLDRRTAGEDPLIALADAYFGSIPDAFRRPNSGLYQWMKKAIGKRGIRGVILRRYVWCDTWSAEAHRMSEWLDVPFLHLDVSDDHGDSIRTKTRLQAFIEMLK